MTSMVNIQTVLPNSVNPAAIPPLNGYTVQIAAIGPPGPAGGGGVSYSTVQGLTSGQQDQALRNIGAARIIEPEQFNTGTDQGNLQACINYGSSATDFVRVNLRSKVYTIGTSGSSTAGLTYDGSHGTLYIDARGAQIIYQGTGSLLSANVQAGSNNPPRITTMGGYWEGLTAAFGFDGTDIRTFTHIEPDVYFPVGAAFRLLNQNIWCERNSYERVRDNGSKQLLVCDVADFVTGSIAVTFTASNNQIAFASAHKSAVGDRMKFTGLTGGAGITSGATYYVQSVVSTTVVTVAATVGGAQVDITSNGTGSGFLQPSSSMARTRVFEAKITGGVATFCKIQIKNGAGCYDSHFSARGNIPDGAGVIDVLGAGSMGDTDLDFRCEPVSNTAGGAFLMRAGQAGGFPPTLSPTLDVDRLNMFDPLAAAPDGTALIFGQHKFRGFESQTYRTNSFTDFYGRTTRAALAVPNNPSVWITSGGGTGPESTFGNMILTPGSGKHIYTDMSGGSGTANYRQLDLIAPGTMLGFTNYSQSASQTQALTPAAFNVLSDMSGAAITAAWTGAAAGMFDVVFLCPASGVVDIEIQANLSVGSGTTIAVRLALYDVTAAAGVTNSTAVVCSGTGSTRATYKQRFSLTAGTTYTWRPQWCTSNAANVGQLNAGGVQGTVRTVAYASI